MKHILKKLMAVFLTALAVFGSLGSDVYAAFTSGTGEYCLFMRHFPILWTDGEKAYLFRLRPW